MLRVENLYKQYKTDTGIVEALKCFFNDTATTEIYTGSSVGGVEW